MTGIRYTVILTLIALIGSQGPLHAGPLPAPGGNETSSATEAYPSQHDADTPHQAAAEGHAHQPVDEQCDTMAEVPHCPHGCVCSSSCGVVPADPYEVAERPSVPAAITTEFLTEVFLPRQGQPPRISA